MRGRKPIGEQTMTAAERQRRRRTSEAYRRVKPIKITWSADGARIGRIYVGSEYWGAVEWSRKRKAWCIEDAVGACLAHAEHIRGNAKTKELAVELAETMIRDGRMPSPEEAKRQFQERHAARPPSPPPLSPEEQEQRKAEVDHSIERWQNEQAERKATPLWEEMHDIFDFGDPDLWRSNSFAVLRPRLIIHIKAVVAKCEQDCELWGKRRRRMSEDWRRRHLTDAEAKLNRAREVLAALEAT
jgi:hypothetical protein